MPFHQLAGLAVDREQVAIAVTKGAFGAHIGVVFNRLVEGLSVLHLAGHLDVRVDEVSAISQCWVASLLDLPTVLSKQVVALVRNVAIDPPRISYGLNLVAVEGSFNSNGRYSAPPGSDGLTCASFVSELFSGAGLDLVLLDAWPSTPENVEWGKAVIEFVCRHGASAEHAATLHGTNKGFRLHPFEVAGAGNTPFAALPLGFAVARIEAEKVRSDLERLC